MTDTGFVNVSLKRGARDALVRFSQSLRDRYGFTTVTLSDALSIAIRAGEETLSGEQTETRVQRQ